MYVKLIKTTLTIKTKSPTHNKISGVAVFIKSPTETAPSLHPFRKEAMTEPGGCQVAGSSTVEGPQHRSFFWVPGQWDYQESLPGRTQSMGGLMLKREANACRLPFHVT